MMRSMQVTGAMTALIVGLGGCGEKSDVPPVEYGVQKINAKPQSGPPKHVTPSGMEPAESRSANPLP
ncbi:hypothetical protein TA3x_004705 [Tundrisphaera sp. TA3]|uniref:hypothetical protein n=1 Tax=Tundrisphaera sp. TA3 TaxID=3435775 RepID=UPI003EB9F172